MATTRTKKGGSCPREPTLKKRALLNTRQAAELGNVFKLLSGTTRLRLLHALERNGGYTVGELAEELRMKPQAVSNQLQRLAVLGIIEATRNGLHIHYRIVDPCVTEILDYAWCLVECASDSKLRVAS